IYWKLLSAVPALQVLANRMVWSAVFVALFCLATHTSIKPLLQQKRAVGTFVVAAIIVTFNWGIYIWGINAGHVVECALGYYINPLVTILIGLFFFHERLSRAQAIAFVLAAIGVIYFTVGYGHFPWLAIGLALSFGSYGAVKKWGAYPALQGMALESIFTSILGLGFMLAGAIIPAFWQLTPVTDVSPLAVGNSVIVVLLLIFGGFVTFALLQLFASAANKVPLKILGFVQYLSPTINLILALLLFGEPFTLAHGICFGCIWLGIACIVIEALRESKREHAKEG
ncbi:MAG: EamA family transporter RarD, partial [Coriobacteriales bacterium]|nr:EamA family transporter RarD [Coriobacteriales bacterium]